MSIPRKRKRAHVDIAIEDKPVSKNVPAKKKGEIKLVIPPDRTYTYWDPVFFATRGDQFFEPVRHTEEGTVFPMDYLAPGGYAEYEYGALCQAASRIDNGHGSFNGHNWTAVRTLSENLKVKKPIEQVARDLMRERSEQIKQPKFLYPSNMTFLERKYARFITRTKCNLPTIFPFAFSPVSHRYVARKDRGLVNEITGNLADGSSCSLNLTGFEPYLYFQLPDQVVEYNERKMNIVCEELLEELDKKLISMINDALEQKMKWGRRTELTGIAYAVSNDMTKLIGKSPVIEKHINVRMYRGKIPKPFLRITACNPMLIRVIKLLLQAPYGGYNSFTKKNDEAWLPEKFRPHGFEGSMYVAEGHIDFTMRFLVDNDLSAAGTWFVYNNFAISESSVLRKESTNNIEIFTNYRNLRRASDAYVTDNPPIKQDAKFDIEVSTGPRFPVYYENPVTQIVKRSRFGPLGQVSVNDTKILIDTPMPPGIRIRKKGCRTAICLCLGDAPPSPDYSVLCFSREEFLLIAFMELMIVTQPDFIAGHYSETFDWPYLLDRAKFLGLGCFPYFSRVFNEPVRSTIKEKGNNKKGLFRPCTRAPGMVVWDFLNHVTDFMFVQHKSLNALSKSLLDEQKIEVVYSLIRELNKTREGRGILNRYCEHDVWLLDGLDDKTQALRFRHTMATMCYCPIQLLQDRASIFRMTGVFTHFAQQHYNIACLNSGGPNQYAITTVAEEVITERPKIDSKTHPFLYHSNKSDIQFLTPSPSPYYRIDANQSEGYKGATVITPCPGYYTSPVQTLDFKSLYPSVMQGFNLCPSTHIPPGKQKLVMGVYGLEEKDIWHVPTFMLSEDGFTTIPCTDVENNPSFVRREVMVGIINYIETFLMDKRAIVTTDKGALEAQAKTEKDPIIKSNLLLLAGVYGLYGNAIKVVCNGLYGVLGMPGGHMANIDIAMTITRMSRQALEFTRYMIMREFRKRNGYQFDVVIVYGDTDSVFVIILDFNGIVLWNGEISRAEKDKLTLAWMFQQNDVICAFINSFLPKTMCLQNEKGSVSELLRGSKKYGILMTLKPHDPPKIKVTGMTSVRRGGCLLLRNLCVKVLHCLLVERDVEKAIEYGRETVRRVRERRVTQKELIMCSSLSKEPKDYLQAHPAPHVAMAKKIQVKTGIPMRAGDRISYLIVPGVPGSRVSERTETPLNCIEKNLDYDKQYYLDAVMKELVQLFGPIFDQRTFREKFMFSEEMRKLSFDEENGAEKERKAKAKLKKIMDGNVISVFLHNKVLPTCNPTPSFDDLPDEYKEDLPLPKYHWGGYDPNEKLMTVKEYKLMQTKKKIGFPEEFVPMNSKEEEKEEEDSGDENLFGSDDEEEEHMTDRGEEDFSCFDVQSIQFGSKKQSEDNKGSEISAFVKMFRQPPNKKTKYGKEKAKIVAGRKPINGLTNFVYETVPCEICGIQVKLSTCNICDRCAMDPVHAEQRRKNLEEKIETAKKLAEEAKATHNRCVECVSGMIKGVKDVENLTMLINGCDSMIDCENWAPKRQTEYDAKRAQEKCKEFAKYVADFDNFTAMPDEDEEEIEVEYQDEFLVDMEKIPNGEERSDEEEIEVEYQDELLVDMEEIPNREERSGEEENQICEGSEDDCEVVIFEDAPHDYEVSYLDQDFTALKLGV